MSSRSVLCSALWTGVTALLLFRHPFACRVASDRRAQYQPSLQSVEGCRKANLVESTAAASENRTVSIR
jgi:hypothetical protein